ncbi:MAG: polysaccharide biosynthesis protein [Candidatus Omnitrophica bacterium]|nr:polysaccharide biosynthesis protein [Candidatus Omnitrophota bacterium]
MNFFLKLKRHLFLLKFLIDISLVIFSYWFSFYLRFEGEIPQPQFNILKETIFIFLVSFLVCDIFLGLTKSIYRYTSLGDIQKIGFVVLASTGLFILLSLLFSYNIVIVLPRSIYILNAIILFLSLSGARLFYRTVFEKLYKIAQEKENVLIVGDKDIAVSLHYSILKDTAHKFKIVGFITFEQSRVGDTINTIPIIGMPQDIHNLVRQKKIKYIFIALDNATTEQMKSIIKICQATEAIVRIVPSIVDVINGKFSLKDLREIRFEDYLEREPIKFDIAKLKNAFYKKNILITGGGGSIGCNIAKQLLKFSPNQLFILDISERNIFEVFRKLKDIQEKENLKDTQIFYRILDIRDKLGLEKFSANLKLDYVIHTAALKHVFLCEENILEAITTNIYGTLNMIEFSIKLGAEKFIYISTDKAVEPISIMGATKRVGELLVKNFSLTNKAKTKFISVRFGNVIGSSSNVIEIFSSQLQKKEPLTITDENMQRFFMSLDEATKLILESIYMGKGGEIFILDMGLPIKIKDLASDIALFYGKNLKEEDIIYIGKRKGEKIIEKLYSQNETKIPTEHPKIFRVEENIDVKDLVEKLKNFEQSLYQYEEKQLKDWLFSLIS